MPITIQRGDIHLIDLETRLPFKYGIATMTRAPQAFVRMFVEVDGRATSGVSADLLPPKWFTKVPDKPLDAEVDEMLAVIEHAVGEATGMTGESAYDLWRQLYDRQARWGGERGLPALLSNFGTTLVERALIEALAKARNQPFSGLVRENALGIRLSEFDERLAGCEPADLLPAEPLARVIARQTVGMADPLTDADIAPGDRLDDGLPQSLVESIRRYGLKHFKIKVSGQLASDAQRLRCVAAVLQEYVGNDFVFSLDGNEQFRSLEEFCDFWRTLTSTQPLPAFFEHLLFVEQPFHRDVALDADVLGELRDWSDRPLLIIDESDAELDSLQRALGLGFHGTSHKNCKGVFRGIMHACLLERLRREDSGGTYIMSGEDLANIGPVALLQDLAAAASLGVQSIERNGHHYFAGLSAFPLSVQEQVLENHNDLYYLTTEGWPAVDIDDGRLDIASVVAAPFGVGFTLNVELFTPADQWRQNQP